MQVATRELTVLGEFKPFGLIAEALDGKPQDASSVSDKYDYFLFDPDTVRDGNGVDDSTASALSDHCDHELFIRGNKILWSTGARVFKRFTLPSEVITACWCRLGEASEACLCILQADTITLYSISGEVIYVPLPWAITSIWPLPCGLLLQAASEGSPPTHSSLSSAHRMYTKRETRHSPQQHFSLYSPSDQVIKNEAVIMSSHLILKDLFDEPQPTCVEERGKWNIMKDLEERTIWTSDRVPLMASYNRGQSQHSVWVAEIINANLEVANGSSADAIPSALSAKQLSFRRIWQGKGTRIAACKVFLATDDDASPIICFLLQEQKKLLSLRLQMTEINNEIVFDIKPDMSWSIPAIAAAPVVVTRPRVKVGQLPYSDIIALAPDNTLSLYSGQQCLCRYSLPPCLGKLHHSSQSELSNTIAIHHDSKVLGLADAVEGRFNLIVNSGQMFRCVLRSSLSSELVNDCITVMADGLCRSLYNHFLLLLWSDGDSDYSMSGSVHSEWDSFCIVILRLCGKSDSVKCTKPPQVSSWEFLMNSNFHKNYRKVNVSGAFSSASQDEKELPSQGSIAEGKCSLPNSVCFQLLKETLGCLHALYETLKLDSLRQRDLELLVVLLCNIAAFLGQEGYLDHYIRDFPGLDKQIKRPVTSSSWTTPPSLFRWLEQCLQNGCNSANANDLPPLICKDGSYVVSLARKIVSFYSLLCGGEQMGKKLSSGVYCNVALGSFCSTEELTILAMVGEKFGLQQLDTLPSGVSLPLRHALSTCRESPPTDWPASAYVLLGREDLALSRLVPSRKSNLGSRSDVNLISMSTPYMLHLHPVTIPSTVTETVGLESSKLEETTSDVSVVDGMEHIFTSSTQLRYGRDLRLNEVRRALCSARPVAIQTSTNPSASDQDIQQTQLWHLAQRTTALPLGRGAFTLATISTLLTEEFAVPKLVLAGRLPAQQNATVNLDPNIRNIQELISWPEFHNAVAAGLRLAPLQGKVSRTWIIYNKPEVPNAVHAGLLLALGLHGYLHGLIMSDIYKYFTQEHESTTVGLMLGLAASYRGTMQPSISKCLYFHIPALQSTSLAELELPSLLQSAALVSVGMLYEGSVHPQTMQILLVIMYLQAYDMALCLLNHTPYVENLQAELGRRSSGDNVLEREGYAVSAGFALGLVALGRGNDALGFVDSLVDRLFRYIGGKELNHQDRPLSFNVLADESNRSAGQVMDGTAVSIDVTAPGAIIALALMFIKTESEAIVSKLSIPKTHYELQYVRPDFIMLRVIARNLIMWSRVQPSKDWILNQIPEIVVTGVKGIVDDTSDIDEMDAETFVQAYVNIVAGTCISLGLKFAGTRDGNVQELLYECALYFLNEIKPVCATKGNSFPKGLSRYVDRSTLEICLHLVVLALSVVMAGSGHLQTFRLLKFLRSRSSPDGHTIYGIQMAVSMAIGFLFLGGGMRTFSKSNSAIAALLISLYPRLPTGPNDNRCHLQAFRHLYVLATEARWIQTVDVDSGLPVYVPIEVSIKETEYYSETDYSEVTPCILPDRSILKKVCICGPRYWSQKIELLPEDKPWWSFGDKNDPFNSGILYVKRKVGACSYVDDPIGRQSLLSRAMHKVFGLTSVKAWVGSNNRHGSLTVDQLVSTFSSDPSLIAFAQLCCDASWNSRSDVDFQEFCLQVLFECISRDRPALLQVYLSLYTTLASLADQVSNGTLIFRDSLAISSLKLAVTYNEAVLRGKLTTWQGSIVQSTFLGSLKKRMEELLNHSEELNNDLRVYLSSGRWPNGTNNSVLLSWYLQWFGVPSPSVINAVATKLKPLSVPLFRLLLPRTDVNAVKQIVQLLCINERE
ncbi:Anaphase-promoting complex subunit 1 [Linum perenne]